MSANVIQFRAPTTPNDITEAAAAHRQWLTQGREHLLADLRPHITRDYLSINEAAAYFRIPLPNMLSAVAAYRTELSAVGYRPDTGLSRRSILHVALLLPLKESERADVLKRALGEWSAQRRPTAAAVVPNHERYCHGLLRTAAKIAEDIQDGDVAAMWREIEDADKETLHGLVVALAAMLPLDQPSLRQYLTHLGLDALRDAGESAHPSRAAAAGLATLVPEPKAGA